MKASDYVQDHKRTIHHFAKMDEAKRRRVAGATHTLYEAQARLVSHADAIARFADGRKALVDVFEGREPEPQGVAVCHGCLDGAILAVEDIKGALETLRELLKAEDGQAV